jgi:uncharacterized protein Yka (UPF0111/DUF47 family)
MQSVMDATPIREHEFGNSSDDYMIELSKSIVAIIRPLCEEISELKHVIKTMKHELDIANDETKNPK